jgi:type I restriction enzyme S subunit
MDSISSAYAEAVQQSDRAHVEANLKRAARLRQEVLKRAFAGRLVPQDPIDEPAEKLLGRIVTQRAASGAKQANRSRLGTRGSPLRRQATFFGEDG